MTVAIYTRVSTREKGQDAENQGAQLREYCARQGWQIVAEYTDNESGKHGNRQQFRKLFEDASKRKFDLVLVWSLDRLTREGVHQTFGYIETLTGFGVKFESYTEQHFRTTGPAGELMLAVAAWIAKQERLRISDRTKAGLERAVRQGKRLGRPGRVFRRDEAVRLRGEGLALRAIARELDVPLTTVVRELKKEAGK